jgi:phosphate:Na+ symporter
MKSDNAHIRKEYDRLRRLVVRVLREIEALRSADDQARHTLSLDRLKLEIEEKLDKIGNGLDTLIREDLIDVQMATSMMNDISYTREICWDLVDAGSVLFSEMGLEDKAAMRSIALDEHEIIEMMNQGEEGTTR